VRPGPGYLSRPSSERGEAFLHRFDLEHTFRLFKQVLGWTAPKIRGPQAAPRPRGRDSDHPPDPLALECVARRPGEVHVGGLDALGVRVREHQPEHRVGARERLGADVDVAMRSLHDLDASRVCEARREGSRAVSSRCLDGPAPADSSHPFTGCRPLAPPLIPGGPPVATIAARRSPSDTTREIVQPDRPDLCASADGRRGPCARAERRRCAPSHSWADHAS
jgi:hypothetical protein